MVFHSSNFAEKQAESAFAAIRERLEQRLTAAESAVATAREGAAGAVASCDERDAAAAREGEASAHVLVFF